TIPFIDHKLGRQPEVAAHGLELAGQLIGDDEPDVQKALSWAPPSLVIVDADAVTAFVTDETETASGTGDGHRAWVIRDTLPKLEAATAADLRARLDRTPPKPGAPPPPT